MLKTLALKLSEGFTDQCREYQNRLPPRELKANLQLRFVEQDTFLQNLGLPDKKGLYI
jgi:hypothetical protein